jgi:hypothetical protein
MLGAKREDSLKGGPPPPGAVSKGRAWVAPEGRIPHPWLKSCATLAPAAPEEPPHPAAPEVPPYPAAPEVPPYPAAPEVPPLHHGGIQLARHSGPFEVKR